MQYVDDLPPEDIGDLARAMFRELRLGEFEPYIKACTAELLEHDAITKAVGDNLMAVTAEHLPRGTEFQTTHQILSVTTLICLGRSYTQAMEEFTPP